MYAFHENLVNLRSALATNVLVLVAPAGQVTDEHRLAIGRVLLDMLTDRGRLYPSFWVADGDESADTVTSLDKMAVLSKKLYFTLLQNPADVEHIGPLIAGISPADLESGTTYNHCWLNAMRTFNPPDSFIIGLGDWLYSLRDSESPLIVGSLSSN